MTDYDNFDDIEGVGACKCGQPGDFSHSCPYRAELNNDEKTLCNCCSACRQDCAHDV